MPITAIKNGLKRIFSEDQWNRMPKDKFGWKAFEESDIKNVKIPDELVQKKMVQGATVKEIIPNEIIKTDERVPEELLSKPVKKVVPKPAKTKK